MCDCLATIQLWGSASWTSAISFLIRSLDLAKAYYTMLEVKMFSSSYGKEKFLVTKEINIGMVFYSAVRFHSSRVKMKVGGE